MYCAQRGLCRLPNYLDCGKPLYEEYESFRDRFNAVENVLRSSKEAVGRLFRGITFGDRLAWRPKTELGLITKNSTTMYQRNDTNVAGMIGSEAGNPPQNSTVERREAALRRRKVRKPGVEALSTNNANIPWTQNSLEDGWVPTQAMDEMQFPVQNINILENFGIAQPDASALPNPLLESPFVPPDQYWSQYDSVLGETELQTDTVGANNHFDAGLAGSEYNVQNGDLADWGADENQYFSDGYMGNGF
ncbi:hypothetical protein F4805DRAFT_447380 [Annulohypoxylon moriforme]|nr:hypothetical protein F4805DRAFT_447380 [Annulohypoxylon moriforme]